MYRIIICLGLLFLLGGCRSRYDSTHQIVPLTVISAPQKTIVIDAGHGGRDPGSESTKWGYEEKKLTLATAQLLADYLRDEGYHVIMTRQGDQYLSLKERSEIANREKADLFVSLHYNYSSNREVEGIEVYYYEDKEGIRKKASLELGEKVLARLLKHTKAHSRGVKAGNYAVIRETKMPAILVEGGFLSHPSELERLKDPKYIHFLAFGIARGINAYFGR